MKRLFMVIIVFLYIITMSLSIYSKTDNLIKNSSFEVFQESKNFKNWGKYLWNKSKKENVFSYDDLIFKVGRKSAVINCRSLNDARLTQKIKVNPQKYYKISCWVKTENINKKKLGANISIIDVPINSNSLTGDNDWTLLELYIKPDKNAKNIIFSIGLGGYGNMNSGKMWIDDVRVKPVKKVPNDDRLFDLNEYKIQEDLTGQKLENAINKLSQEKLLVFFKYIFMGLIPIIIILGIILIAKVKLNKNKFLLNVVLSVIVLSGLFVRVILRLKMQGHPTDIGCFTAWSTRAAANLIDFYKDGLFVDYPPIYIFILSVFGKIANLLKIAWYDSEYLVIISIPAMISDIIIGLIIYKNVLKRYSVNKALIMFILIIFNPLFILDSSVWGQVDSFFSLIILIMLILLYKSDLPKANLLLIIAIFVKPQGLIFLPVIGYNFILSFIKAVKDRIDITGENRKKTLIFVFKNDYLKKIMISLGYFIGVTLIVLLPFKKTYENPFWILKLYHGTVSSQYQYATLNSFNLYGAFKANWVDDSEKFFIFSYSTWGMIFIVTVSLLVGVMFLISFSKRTPIATSLVLIVSVFVLSTKMHERYMFPAIIIAAVAMIYYKRIGYLWIFGLLSLTNFLNVWQVYVRSLKDDFAIPNNDKIMLFGSTMNILILFGIIIYVLSILWDEKKAQRVKGKEVI